MLKGLGISAGLGGLLLQLADPPSLALKVIVATAVLAVPLLVAVWHAGFRAGSRWSRRAS